MIASVPYVAGYAIFVLLLVLLAHWAIDKWKGE